MVMIDTACNAEAPPPPSTNMVAMDDATVVPTSVSLGDVFATGAQYVMMPGAGREVVRLMNVTAQERGTDVEAHGVHQLNAVVATTAVVFLTLVAVVAKEMLLALLEAPLFWTVVVELVGVVEDDEVLMMDKGSSQAPDSLLRRKMARSLGMQKYTHSAANECCCWRLTSTKS